LKKVILAYVPVLHAGYRDFFQEYSGKADAILILTRQLIATLGEEFDYLARKDALRALDAVEMAAVIRSLGMLSLLDVKVLNLEAVRYLADISFSIIAPDEDISRAVVERYFPERLVQYESVFLRWDRTAVMKAEQVASHRNLSITEFDREMMRAAKQEANRSFDWWRQVGAVLVKDGEAIFSACNVHLPDEQAPNAFGDPRSIFRRGVHLELSTAEHAEATVIGEAAAQGIATRGASLYVTTFPCPPCAKLIARAGIKRCYFSQGYAQLDGESVLKQKNVELVYVDMPA